MSFWIELLKRIETLIISAFIVDVFGRPQLFIVKHVKNAWKALIITVLLLIIVLVITIEKILSFSFLLHFFILYQLSQMVHNPLLLQLEIFRIQKIT